MIAVLTAPRASKSYLAATLADIDASAKSTRKIVVCDGATPSLPSGWRAEPFIRPVAQPQNKWAAWRAFELAADVREDLCLYEDDLELCSNAAAVIEEFIVPDHVAFVMFYAPWGNGSTPPGLWCAHTNTYVYAQMLKLPLRTCEALCGLRGEMERCRLGGSDEAIKAVTAPLGWRWGVHYPGLVQHVGSDSAVGNGLLRGTRVSREYPGKSFDARSIRYTDSYR